MTRTVLRPWLIAWLGGAGIGVVNGVVREATYARWVGERAAHNVSGATGIGSFAAFFWALHRRWPIPTPAEARRIGLAWLVMTVAFEFGFGRAVAKQSWSELLADYDVTKGRTWPLVLAWLTAGPSVVRRIQR